MSLEFQQDLHHARRAPGEAIGLAESLQGPNVTDERLGVDAARCEEVERGVPCALCPSGKRRRSSLDRASVAVRDSKSGEGHRVSRSRAPS
jgi:hypothetical protein